VLLRESEGSKGSSGSKGSRFGRYVRPDVRICWVLMHNGGKLSCSEIARQCEMSVQRTRYQLKNLVQAGVVIRDSDRLYSLQPFFHDEEFVGSLYEMLRPLLDAIFPRMDWSYVDSVGGVRDIALLNSLRMFLAIADLELRGLTLLCSSSSDSSSSHSSSDR